MLFIVNFQSLLIPYTKSSIYLIVSHTLATQTLTVLSFMADAL